LTFNPAAGILRIAKQLRYGLGILGPVRIMQGSYRRIAGFAAPDRRKGAPSGEAAKKKSTDGGAVESGCIEYIDRPSNH
jgi:hypothetical protein